MEAVASQVSPEQGAASSVTLQPGTWKNPEGTVHFEKSSTRLHANITL